MIHWRSQKSDSYVEVIDETTGMVQDLKVQALAKRRGLNILDVTWEVGSLVTEGETGRPTEYDGSKQEPPDWWDDFWQRHERNTGQLREEAIAMLHHLRPHWQPPANQLELLQALGDLEQSNEKLD